MNNNALKKTILGSVVAAYCMACPAAEQQTPPGEVRAGNTKLVAVTGTMPIAAQETPTDLKDWGPFAKPWKRYEKNPILKLEDDEKYQIQNGPQTVIQWQGKWYMFMMCAMPYVTKLAVSDDGLTWERPHHNYVIGVATSKDGITWTDSEKSPVLTGPDPKSQAWDLAIGQCSVVKIGDWFVTVP